MPRGRPKGSKNKSKIGAVNPAPVEKEVIARQKAHAKRHPKEVQKADEYAATLTSNVAPAIPAKRAFFDNSRFLLPEMLTERKKPVVVPSGIRRVSFSSFDIPNCHRFAKMLMTKYGYTDPSMPKPKKDGSGWYTFEITEPVGGKNVD